MNRTDIPRPDLESDPARTPAGRGPCPVRAVLGRQAYSVPKCADASIEIYLDGNEGSRPDPAALLRECALDAETLRSYPRSSTLAEDLRVHWGLPTGGLLLTAGADEALDRLCRAYLEPGRNAVLPEPTFVMIRRYVELAGATATSVPWPTERFPLDAVLDAVDEKTGVVFIVSPNNPTGASATVDDLRAVSAAAPDALVVVDAAYAEFAKVDLSEAALSLPNVVVVRTFSKAWGLAGCRVGYVMGSPEWIEPLRITASPYPVAAFSEQLAQARWRTGGAAIASFVDEVRGEVAALSAQLTEAGFAVIDSEANFVFARGARAAWLREALAGFGFAVRTFEGVPDLADAVRITCPGDARLFARLSHAVATACAPEAILFDVDGVLVDVSGSYRKAIIATAREFGVVVDGAAIATAKAKGGANDDWDLTTSLIRTAGVEASAVQVTEVFERLYQGDGADAGLRASERPTFEREDLEALGQRYALGIVTGRPRADAERAALDGEWGDLFGTSVCREDAPLKPDPAPVQLALTRLGLSRGWFLGDTPDDVVAARRAGVLPIGVVPPGENDVDGWSRVLKRAGAAWVIGAPVRGDRARLDLGRLEEMLP